MGFGLVSGKFLVRSGTMVSVLAVDLIVSWLSSVFCKGDGFSGIDCSGCRAFALCDFRTPSKPDG